MPYISQLLGGPVADVDGSRIGTLRDLIALGAADFLGLEIQ
jgi:ribosomal 30S subunit maturation factor RimM